MIEQTNLYYKDLLKDIYKFRYMSAVTESNALGYNSKMYDEPNYYYFKLFFKFNQDDPIQSGLLSYQYSNANEKSANYLRLANNIDTIESISAKERSQELGKLKGNKPLPTYTNSAFNFLLNNDEIERADLLIKFIQLLQDINCNYPWYFQKITGLKEIMERPYFQGAEFKIEEERPTIIINCLEDSKDDKIGTLLDLYRAVCFSEVNKREIVPANLRKFDLGIMVFSVPCRHYNTLNKHDRTKFQEALSSGVIDSLEGTSKIVSSKYYELHNCEIKYKSAAKLVENLDNSGSDGGKVQYDIELFVEDVKENRWNEFLCRNIGDFIKNDINPTKLQEDLEAKMQFSIDDVQAYKSDKAPKGWLGRTVDVLKGHAIDHVMKHVQDLMLGNIYKDDFGNFLAGAQNIVNSSNAWEAGQVVGSFIHKKEKKQKIGPKNIYEKQNAENQVVNPDNIYK